MSPPTSRLIGCAICNAYASHILQSTLGLHSCQPFTVTFSLSINLTILLLDKSFLKKKKKKICFIHTNTHYTAQPPGQNGGTDVHICS